MKRALLAAAATLSLAVPAGVVVAQDAMATTDATVTPTLTPEQQTMYDGWPADRRTMYDAWPDTYKVYYWTLTPEQQTGWWALNDDQRGRVYAMTPAQRTAAWASIAAQMSGAPPAATAGAATEANMSTSANTTMATPGMGAGATAMASGNMQFVSNPVVQNIPMDQATGDVPVCNEGQTDNCINAWEAGRRGANVTRPLQDWPGQPASETD